jgi:disulfide bond formation protein DsbB
MAPLTPLVERNRAALLALAISVVAALSLLGAYYFEYILKLAPCPLCLQQRWAYYLAVPLATAVAWAAASDWPPTAIRTGFAILLVMFLGNAVLGVYHAGAEWKFWPGPATCAAIGDPLPLNAGTLLEQMNQAVIVRCDEAAWRFLGLSLAGYSVLISLAVAGAALAGLTAGAVQGSSSVSQYR